MSATMRQAAFVSALLDTSFSEFITLKIIKWLYLAAMLGVGLLGLFLAFAGFAQGFLIGLGSLIVVALVSVLAITVIRVWFEAAVVFFRIAENTAEVAEQAAAIAVNTAAQPSHPIHGGVS